MFLYNLHKKVCYIRLYQHVVHELIKSNSLKIVPHMAFGYEALSVALTSLLDPRIDRLSLTHRNISYNLSLVDNFKMYLNELNLKKSGINKGITGSMNIINPKKGILYTSSILGNNLAISTGIAMDNKLSKYNKGVTFVVTGDGAIEEGAFYESLLMATSLKLRLVVIIENNNFAMASTIKERRINLNIKKICNLFNIDYLKLSNNNVADYYKKLLKIKKNIIKQSKPAIVEVKIKMFNNHYGQTPGWIDDPKVIDFKNGLVIDRSNSDPCNVSLSKLKNKTINFINKDFKNYLKKYKIHELS